MTLLDLLDRHADASPDAPFVTAVSTGVTVSYGEVRELAHRLRELLLRETERGDRVVLMSVNHWIFFPLLAAAAEEGRVLVPLNPHLHSDELAFIFGDSTPSMVIQEGAEALPGDVEGTSVADVMAAAAISDAPFAADAGPRPDENEVTLLVYTSGTTGSGKAVMLTTKNLVSMAETFVEYFEIEPNDRFLCVLPLYHMNGIMVTGILPLVVGARTFLADVFAFTNAKFYWDVVERSGVTIPSLVPSIMAMLAKLSPDGPKAELGSVRFGFCGTAPLPARQWEDFERLFGFPIFQGYGLTETTTWVTATPFDPDHRHDTVGIPFGADVVIDPTLRTATGREEGEILVRGPMVMPGYFNQSKLTRESFRDGYLKTGDVGFFDQDGELNITGRKKEIIIRNGVNINPLEVDVIVQRHPDIAESKTIGLDHEILGEVVATVCVPEEGSTPDPASVKDWVRNHMSAFYVPDEVISLPYLPKGPTGKVAIRTLRGIVSGETARDTLKKLTAWKYKRSKPSDSEQILEIIDRAFRTASPIPMLTYWGCGARDSLGDIDRTTLDRLAEYFRSALLVPASPVSLTLMLNDVHSRINGIPQQRFESYYGQIGEYAEELGFEVVWQSTSWKELGLDLEELNDHAAGAEFDRRWEEFPLREQLVKQAESHYQGGPPEMGARRYGLACLTEGPAFGTHYGGHVFLTYNGPGMDACLPDLPKLYLYSYKKGTTVKPWFM